MEARTPHFADRALYLANPREEFCFATPAEVREVLAAKVGSLLGSPNADAIEFLQSRGSWPTQVTAPGPAPQGL